MTRSSRTTPVRPCGRWSDVTPIQYVQASNWSDDEEEAYQEYLNEREYLLRPVNSIEETDEDEE